MLNHFLFANLNSDNLNFRFTDTYGEIINMDRLLRKLRKTHVFIYHLWFKMNLNKTILLYHFLFDNLNSDNLKFQYFLKGGFLWNCFFRRYPIWILVKLVILVLYNFNYFAIISTDFNYWNHYLNILWISFISLHAACIECRVFRWYL